MSTKQQDLEAEQCRINSIRRSKDFGLTWNAALKIGGILVGEEVTITLEAELVKA